MCELFDIVLTNEDMVPKLAPVPCVPVDITPATVSSDTVPNLTINYHRVMSS